MNFMTFDFIFEFFLFQGKKIHTKVFFLPSLRQISIQQMSVVQLMQLDGKCFFGKVTG